MKTNIKMRVTPEQSKQVQKIVFANGGCWSVSLLQEELYLSAPFLYLELLEYCTEDEMKKEKILIYGEEEEELFLKADGYKEIDADLFIRTNGTCELDSATTPNHYTKMKIAPNEYITANYDCFSWNTANVIKYVSRYKSKNGIEDLEKAIKYLQFEIEELRKAEQ